MVYKFVLDQTAKTTDICLVEDCFYTRPVQSRVPLSNLPGHMIVAIAICAGLHIPLKRSTYRTNLHILVPVPSNLIYPCWPYRHHSH